MEEAVLATAEGNGYSTLEIIFSNLRCDSDVVDDVLLQILGDFSIKKQYC